ncbi:MAG: hypothetical protein HON90_01440 [Halobacteriovoraceae bacterium]|jgi:hypothetical protein|nr:hypothetical protein [Halobacteriovoraceae bacterium]
MLKKSTALSLLLLSTGGFCAESADADATSSTTVEKAAKAKKTDKADELITNKRMRAQNGSLSNLSMSSSVTYSGGSVDKPFSADRPNVRAAGDVVSLAAMSADLGASYRINKLNRLGAGIGMKMIAPFNSDISTNDEKAEGQFKRNQGKLDVNDPYVSYTHMNKFGGVQAIMSLSVTHITASSYRDYGYQTSIDSSLNTMYDFGGSSLSVGALFTYGRYLFDKDTLNGENIEADQSGETNFGFYPQAEYVINDKYSLRTIVYANLYENTVAEPNEYTQLAVGQSFGLGVSVSRDVYLYPNVQVAHENLQLSNTNVGITANINMF